ncbi:hypothetical protein LTR56_007738 [Elasticomyces elasticus]|nr:hypothetical protein LTR56_007738 [Elasticomyces elasticus]KAK4925597.1 hypothetical protein LTR49_007435 [Elasticomyces elasticus]KAK5759875.1 hypothetical protein LTS12_010062 [Elasticomyces elasticus]
MAPNTRARSGANGPAAGIGGPVAAAPAVAGPKTAADGVKKVAAKKSKKKAAKKAATKKKAAPKKAAAPAKAAASSSKSGKAIAPDGGESDDDEPPQDPWHPLPVGFDAVDADDEVPADEPLDDFVPGNPLGSAADTIRCKYGPREARKDAWLSGVLQSEQGEHQEFVSYIDSWRIEGRTTAKPQAKERWVDSFLNRVPATPYDDRRDTAAHLEQVAADSHWSETARCLRALYKVDGGLKSAVTDKVAIKNELSNDGLIFIELIHTYQDYAGKGLLPYMLTLYRSLLRQLPEWSAFEDILVLVPCPPSDEELGAQWDEMDRAKKGSAEKALISIYEKADGYIRVVLNQKVNGESITVMGRKVLDEVVEAEYAVEVEGGDAA